MVKLWAIVDGMNPTTSAPAARNIANLDDRYTRSYATREGLETSDYYAEVSHLRHVVCRTPSGRWTAIFIGADAIGPVLLNRKGSLFTVVG